MGENSKAPEKTGFELMDNLLHQEETGRIRTYATSYGSKKLYGVRLNKDPIQFGWHVYSAFLRAFIAAGQVKPDGGFRPDEAYQLISSEMIQPGKCVDIRVDMMGAAILITEGADALSIDGSNPRRARLYTARTLEAIIKDLVNKTPVLDKEFDEEPTMEQLLGEM